MIQRLATRRGFLGKNRRAIIRVDRRLSLRRNEAQTPEARYVSSCRPRTGCFVLRRAALRCAITLAVAFGFPAARADELTSVVTQLVAEVRETVRAPDGRETHRFAPATLLIQGQVVYYTLRIHNPTPVFIDDVEVTQRIPANTTYIAGSAAGPGAEVSLSSDGGRTFEPERARSVASPAPPGASSAYTHIRWKMRYALAPSAVALARFRAVFN